MRYHTPAAFRQALEERLRQREQQTGEPLVRLRKRVVFERCMGPDANWFWCVRLMSLMILVRLRHKPLVRIYPCNQETLSENSTLGEEWARPAAPADERELVI